jgi:hypothetical protein
MYNSAIFAVMLAWYAYRNASPLTQQCVSTDDYNQCTFLTVRCIKPDCWALPSNTLSYTLTTTSHGVSH